MEPTECTDSLVLYLELRAFMLPNQWNEDNKCLNYLTHLLIFQRDIEGCNMVHFRQTLKYTLSVWPWVCSLYQRTIFLNFFHQRISVHKMLRNQ